MTYMYRSNVSILILIASLVLMPATLNPAWGSRRRKTQVEDATVPHAKKSSIGTTNKKKRTSDLRTMVEATDAQVTIPDALAQKPTSKSEPASAPVVSAAPTPRKQDRPVDEDQLII